MSAEANASRIGGCIVHNSQVSERADLAAPTFIVANLQFVEAMRVDSAQDGKLCGRWDAISWAPLVGVGSAYVALIDDLTSDLGLTGRTERVPYTLPGRKDVAIGNDVILMPGDTLVADLLRTIHASCIDFSHQVLNQGDATNLSFDYLGCLSEHHRGIVQEHVDRFRRTWGDKKISEAFIGKIRDTTVHFAKRFCPKLTLDSGPEEELDVVAKLEGAERKNNRVRCTLVLQIDQSQRKAHFEDDDSLLMEVHRRLWDGGYYHMQILESGTASGDRTWDLIRIGGCVQSGTPLFPSKDDQDG
jgi:hypothetical protein